MPHDKMNKISLFYKTDVGNKEIDLKWIGRQIAADIGKILASQVEVLYGGVTRITFP